VSNQAVELEDRTTMSANLQQGQFEQQLADTRGGDRSDHNANRVYGSDGDCDRAVANLAQAKQPKRQKQHNNADAGN